MIAVQLNKNDFEYDIHSLIRAFYPEEQVVVSAENAIESGYLLKIILNYGKNQIEAEILDSDNQRVLKQSSELAETAGRTDRKNCLKALLYQMLCAHTGETLPWGDLTGIRPVKIPMALLEAGKSNVEAAEIMRNTYLLSNEKTALSIMIANKERRILEKLHIRDGYSLYIGIPFCPSICLYCSFSSSPIHIWKDKVDLYLDALCREIAFAGSVYQDRILDTVYIGGGTPTTLEPEQLERLLKAVEAAFDLSRIQEFTVEAGRPDTITAAKLEVLKKHGVSRISINPQTMNQATLDLIGRKHSVQETVDAFRLARTIGFDNINMDLIVGLPGEGMAEVTETMAAITALAPESFTVHSLAVKRAARLAMFQDQYREMSCDNNQEIMDMIYGYAVKSGLAPYYLYRQKNIAGNLENVGYAKEGSEGIYNILIMEEKQTILALGAGAATKVVYSGDRIERIENVKDIKCYIERIDEMIERKRQGLLKYGK